MKRLLASSLVTLVTLMAIAAPPALAESGRKTELVELGASVDRMQLRHDFDAGWVIDDQNVLYRDVIRDHYLVTLREACKQLDVRGRRFSFFPSWSWQLLASNTYEIQPSAGQECRVAKIEKVDADRAKALRDSAERRIW
jgi:hypothetical protein